MSRPSASDLIAEIRANVASSVGTLGLPQQTLAVLYEASIWSLVWDAADTLGATCELRSATHGAAQIVLRAGPCEIWTATAAFTHLRITHGSSVVQAHQGIYLNGVSGAYHQADLAILPDSECDVSLAKRRRPRASKLVFGSEAKCYGPPLGIDIARSFLGLRRDFSSRVALVTCALPRTDQKLIAKHTRGIDVTFHDAAPGRAAWEELRRVIARHLRRALF